MKKILLALSLFSLTASANIKVNRIDPTNWYVGMQDPTLQLMVYGDGIGKANVTTNYPGVKITSVERLESPNYLLIYLDLNNAKAGNVPLVFAQGKKKTTVNYELKKRDMPGDQRMGFSNADVLYMFMPDRFASSGQKQHPMPGLNAYSVDRSQPSLRHGGDLEGIRKHLDYFNELGVTALWFTPVLENNTPDNNNQSTYHGYATTDYYRVDPRFGTNQEYRNLVDEAHNKGLKVVMDMIFNHCGITHPWIKDMPSRNWFNRSDYKSNYLQTSYKLTPVLDPYASEVDMDETVEGWFVPSMPDLNQRNPHVLQYLIQNSIWWIETVGIDGIRMDTYPYADREAMAQWMARLNKEYPNFNTVGETWVTEPAYTAAWQKDSKLSNINSNLKSVMDFAFFDRINQAKNEETDGWWNGLSRVYNGLCYDYLYPNPASVMAFIENHDTDRFLGNDNDTPALKQALALLLTMNRIPQLYYGTEVLMNGTKEKTDGNVRKDFPGGFAGDKHNAFTVEGRTKAQNEMFTWLSQLLHWRKGNEVITKGKQTHFIPFNGIYVLARTLDKRHVLTIANGTSKSAIMPVARYTEVIGDADEVRDVLTGRTISLLEDLQLGPRETLVVEWTEK